MKFNHIYQDVIVNEVKLKRSGSEFQVFVSFQTQSETLHVVLNGVEESESHQAEYGKFNLGISNESYTEICFDSLG